MPTDIAIIVPVFNEADNIRPLVREVAAAFASESRSYELVLVDDASTDLTWKEIQVVREEIPRVRGLRHEVNSGQSAALWTGIQATDSPIIATLDGDLQNDPADLLMLMHELDTVDFVCGVRLERQDNWLRRVSTRVSRWARKTVLGVDFQDTGCAVRVFRRTALAGVFAFNGFHRFLPILVHGNGATTREVPVHHRPRLAGVSKYGVWNRLGRGVYDLLAVAWLLKRRLRPVSISELK